MIWDYREAQTQMNETPQKTSTPCSFCGGEGWLYFDAPDSRMCQRCCGTGRIQPVTEEELLELCQMGKAEWDQLGEDLRTGKETLDTSWIE